MKSSKIMGSKLLVTIVISFILLSACGPGSSPEGRVSIKIESIEKEIADLKQQNKAMLDSLGNIHEALVELKKSK